MQIVNLDIARMEQIGADPEHTGYVWHFDPKKQMYARINTGIGHCNGAIFARDLPDPFRVKQNGNTPSAQSQMLWKDSLKRRSE